MSQRWSRSLRARWISAVPLEFTDANACLSFYSNSYHSLKEYIGYYLDTPTLGLTAEEMRDEMQRLGAQPDLTQKVAQVLETCERLQYAPDGASAHTEIARVVAQDMREILNVGGPAIAHSKRPRSGVPTRSESATARSRKK